MVFDGVSGVGVVILVGVTLGAAINLRIGQIAGGRDVPVARVYRALVVSTAILCVVAAARYLAPTPSTAFALGVLYQLFNLTGNVLALFFVIVYTGNGDWLTRRRVTLFAVEPLVFLGLMATNPLHGALLTDVHTVQVEGLTVLRYGLEPLMMAHLLYVTALSASIYVIMGRFLFRTRRVYRKQASLIFLGSFGIAVAAILYSAGVTPLDLTPFALVINGIVVWVALFRYDFLDVVPLAADLLIEEMTDAVAVTDADGEVLDVNGAAERLFGVTDPVGWSLAAVAPRLDDALAEGEVYVSDGGSDSRTFDPNVTPIHDQYGIERGSLIVLRDVTARVRRQEELQRRNERLDEFASVVSHDLRNPLAIAEGYVDLAREQDDVAHLDRTAEALDRMNELVDDLLTLARNGRSIDTVDPVSLAPVAKAAWENVDTEATLVNDAEGTVEADDQRLQQLFENLFRNATDHAGPDAVIRVGDEADGFYVEDDGPGVPSADRECVFEYGYTTSSSGTGLGLAIVRSIAEAHGWDVGLVDGRDGGARFEFTGAPRQRPA